MDNNTTTEEKKTFVTSTLATFLNSLNYKPIFFMNFFLHNQVFDVEVVIKFLN